MKSNKGFTLIELLAVIVILAIIALIATPIILNIINDARTNAKENSAKYIVSALETSYATAYMKSYSAGDVNGVTVTAKDQGTIPTIDQVFAEMKANIDVKTVDATAKTITSNDGVYCEAANSSDKLTVTCYEDSTKTKTYSKAKLNASLNLTLAS